MNRGGRPEGGKHTKAYDDGKAAGGEEFLKEHQKKCNEAMRRFFVLPANPATRASDTTPDSSKLPATAATAAPLHPLSSVDITYPDAPKAMAQREEGKVYLWKGLPMTWRLRNFVCTCPGSDICPGNQQAARCGAAVSTSPGIPALGRADAPGGTCLTTSTATRGASSFAPAAPRSGQASREDLASINKFKTVIKSDHHHGEILVVNDGVWDKSMSSREVWTASGADSKVMMPLRLHASWVVRHTGGAAAAVNKKTVHILISVGIADSKPFFRARDWGADAGLMGRNVGAETTGQLEKLWLDVAPATKDAAPHVPRGGRRFTGLSSSNLCKYFCGITEGFESVEGESKTAHRGVQERERGEVCERTRRRDKALAMGRFEDMVDDISKELGGSMDRRDVFALLLESKKFRGFTEEAVAYVDTDQQVLKRLVRVYKKTTDKREKRALLSLATPVIGIGKSAALFNVTLYECGKANLFDKMRSMPKNWRAQQTVCRIPKETLQHLEGWVLRRDNVLRAAHGNHGTFQLQRLMNRHLLYIKYQVECESLGVEGIRRSKFYEILSEKIFRDTTRETCCCVQCVQWGDASFESLRGLVSKFVLDASASQQLLDAIDNEEHFYRWIFKSLLRKSSVETAQCMTHALSQSGVFGHVCGHEHVNTAGGDVLRGIEKLIFNVAEQISSMEWENVDEKADAEWVLGEATAGLEKYKAHLVRKAWCSSSQPRMIARLQPYQAFGISDYGEKVLPIANKETQSEAFGKSGFSQFVAAWMITASAFTVLQLKELLGDAGAASVKEGDCIMYTTTVYCDDAKQDWVHSFFCYRAALGMLKEKFPFITEVLLRSDGAGNFKCASAILGMPLLSEITGVRVRELNISEAGNGKNLADSRVQKEKHIIQQTVQQRGGSVRNAGEAVAAVDRGQQREGDQRVRDVAELEFERPRDAGGAQAGALKGIQGLYHFTYDYDDEGGFKGLRVFAHEGLGEGKLYSATECADMWRKEGLDDEMKMELKRASNVVDGYKNVGTILRGDVHKREDEDKVLGKRKIREDQLAEKEQKQLETLEHAMGLTGLKFCPHCAKPFDRAPAHAAHTETCLSKTAAKDAARRFGKMRPVRELEGSKILSSQQLLFSEADEQGQPGTSSISVTFPKPISALPQPPCKPLEAGWAVRPRQVSNRFTKEQIDFLEWLYNGAGSTDPRIKVKEAQGRELMQKRFHVSGGDDPYSARLVLSLHQIKSWLSTRAGKDKVVRQKQAIDRVVDRALSDTAAAVHLDGDGEESRAGGGGAGEPGGSGRVEGESNEEGSRVGGEGGEPGSSRGMERGSVGGGGAAAGGAQPGGTLFLVVKEEWGGDRGFVVWELGGRDWPSELRPEELLLEVSGRMWVHEPQLLCKMQSTRVTQSLKDKKGVSVKLGLCGERRFASRLGRGGEMKMIVPGEMGHAWIKIEREEFDSVFVDTEGKERASSFVFSREEEVVEAAYAALEALG